MTQEMRVARLHKIDEPMVVEGASGPRAATHRRRRPGHGLQHRAEPEERPRHLRRVVPLPPAAPAARDLRARHRRRRLRRSATRSPTSRSATASTSTPASPAAAAAPAAAARTRTATSTRSWATSPSVTDGQQLFDAYPYGGLGEYMTAPQENLVKLPDTVSFEQGARFGYLGTAYSALKKANVGPGTTVLIDGISGTLGLGGCLNALAMGATKIFGTGRNAELLAGRQGNRPRPHRGPRRRRRLPERLRPRAQRRRRRRRRHLHPRPRRPARPSSTPSPPCARGGILVDIGGMMEHPELDLFHMMSASSPSSAASGSPTAKPRRCPTSPAPARSTSPSSSTTCSRWRRSTRPSTTASPPATAASPTSSSRPNQLELERAQLGSACWEAVTGPGLRHEAGPEPVTASRPVDGRPPARIEKETHPMDHAPGDTALLTGASRGWASPSAWPAGDTA